MLSVEDFDRFFYEVHEVAPFPWQSRLLREVVEAGRWPDVLDLFTGSGKTATMDVALFHLALDASRGGRRKAPVRIAFVVDRRLVVDDAHARAKKLEGALRSANGGVIARVAAALGELAGSEELPLRVARLRGGIPREDDWARSPAQPTILCSTVDQVGSRLLFRGYGVSDSMKPIHAGLIGADCLILLDEAHLSEPFRQSLGWVRTYRGSRWRESAESSPWGVAQLTATPGAAGEDPAEQGERWVFGLDAADDQNPTLTRRRGASKPARLILTSKSTGSDEPEESSSEEGGSLWGRIEVLAEQVQLALKHFQDTNHGVPHPAIGVVVNRVARARAVYKRIITQVDDVDVQLIIGPARPIDRQKLVDQLAPIRTGAKRVLQRPLILIATQTIEAGVDIDLDALVTEAAPLDSLRQRFGRLNRDGREIVSYAAIIAAKVDLSGRSTDPIYGDAVKNAWKDLEDHPPTANHKVVDFGVDAFPVQLRPEALAPKDNAPILLPAHLDLLVQTSPVPAIDPDVGLYLHGTEREADSVTLVWRADIRPQDPAKGVRRLMTLVPPRTEEAIELPVWTVRRWLRNRRDVTLSVLADVAGPEPESPNEAGRGGRDVFRWKGHDDRSDWIEGWKVAPGDTIVVPAELGGVDEFGWSPLEVRPATDVGATAARPFASRSFAVRVAPGLLGEVTDHDLAAALDGTESGDWEAVRANLFALPLPDDLRQDLLALNEAKKRSKKKAVVMDSDAYPSDNERRQRGIVFHAPFGLRRGWANGGDEAAGSAGPASTEDDVQGSITGVEMTLETHCAGVAKLTDEFAAAAGLSEACRRDLNIAASLHDAGKADPRFQAWLHYDDPLGGDTAQPILAKSGRPLPRNSRHAAGLPEHWRHEALSVRLAPLVPMFERASDPELVLWLIGSHHGHGRLLFPHSDPADGASRSLPPVLGLPPEIPPGHGPQSLGFSWDGADWATLHSRVSSRYGVWELARMEAIVRLADHRASEREREGDRDDD